MNAMARILVTLLLLVGLTATPLFGQVDLSTYEQLLVLLPLTEPDRALAALETGLSQPGFPATQVKSLIELLIATPGPNESKNEILFLLVRTIESGYSVTDLLPAEQMLTEAMAEGLPIDGIVLEALKGIAQRRSAIVIEQGIDHRLSLLRGVRDLLFQKSLFSTPEGQSSSAAGALPESRFNALLTNVADTISDFLEGGGSPFDSTVLYAQVEDRLTKLSQGASPSIPASDVDLVLERIGPDDLKRVALEAVS